MPLGSWDRPLDFDAAPELEIPVVLPGSWDLPGRKSITKTVTTITGRMAVLDTLIAFVVSLLIGALGIYVGARLLTGVEDYGYAIVTALIGAAVWFVVAFFFGWIPFLGPLLALVAYVAVINYRYPEGWLDAAGIALIAWITVLVVLYVLALVNITTGDAIGVPGV